MRNEAVREVRRVVAVLVRWSRKREWVYRLDPGLMAHPRSVVLAHVKTKSAKPFALHLMAIEPTGPRERTWIVKSDGSILDADTPDI